MMRADPLSMMRADAKAWAKRRKQIENSGIAPNTPKAPPAMLWADELTRAIRGGIATLQDLQTRFNATPKVMRYRLRVTRRAGLIEYDASGKRWIVVARS